MFEALDLQTTDGEIAVINLESARRRSWNRFSADPLREGVAETVLEHEQLTAQFVGDVQALDRLDALVVQLAQFESASARTALIQAQVASMMHRFADAMMHEPRGPLRYSKRPAKLVAAHAVLAIHDLPHRQ